MPTRISGGTSNGISSGLLPDLSDWARRTGAAEVLAAITGHPPVLTVITAEPSVASDIAEGSSPLTTLGDLSNAIVSPLLAGEQEEQITTPDGSGNSSRGDTAVGLHPAEVEQFLAMGADAADRAVDSGQRLLLVAATGSTLASSSLTGVMCRREPAAVVGGDLSEDVRDLQRWKSDVITVRDAMFRARGYRHGPWDPGTVRELLRLLGTPEIAVCVGFLTRAAGRRTPVILDGMTTVTAAMLAEASAMGSSSWWLIPHLPAAKSAPAAVDRLGLDPVLPRCLGTPLGGAGLAVLPLLRAAVAIS